MPTVSETLHRAADLIEKRGLGGDWNDRSETAPLCIEGALLVAAGLTHDAMAERGIASCPGYVAMQNYLGIEGDGRLYEWNDKTGSFASLAGTARTATEVIEVLRAAAAIEESRESALVPSEVAR